MKRLKLFLPLLVFLVLAVLFWRGLSLDPTHMPSALIDRQMPAFSLPSVEQQGVTVTQDALLGKVSLVNVWATWCVTCKAEHKELLAIAEEGVPIYGLNYKDDNEEAQRWLARLGNPYVINFADQDGRLGIDLGVYGAPETYIVDQKGVIRYRHVGAISADDWENTLRPIVRQLQSL